MSRRPFLKPCPFCGAHGKKLVIEDWSVDEFPGLVRRIVCEGCGTSGPTHSILLSGTLIASRDDESAASVWNESRER